MDKKNILTYQGLQKLEDELQNLKVVRRKKLHRRLKKQESRATFPRMPNMMQQRMNSAISKQGLKSWKRS